ncbi:hypothetical protein IC762_30290 [Bradyrhizobium genosp. L]|uniref:DUF6894 family protein n=1 Tax=Bradyrhizobium genosp. L TaxID=83637 RepID=UPI0018A2E0D9|nr:hypothetical protein [Bradyrhizobium genosp. L]QPF83905.1 hypothetical protein IC762_30290 [Bradyrhizobium genosp. L]
MPRYYFHIRHDEYKPDHDGEELPDRHAAWKEATIMAGAMLQDLDGKLRPGHDWQLEVADEFNNPIFRLVIAAEPV